MKWMPNEIVGHVARRVGGQAAAALVALGVAQEHENAVAALVAWVVISAVELAASSRNRRTFAEKAKTAWGRN